MNEITKTVYSMCYPESKIVLDELLSKKDEIHSMYSETFTKKQDAYHHSFLNAFKNWSKPVLDVNWSNFKFSYPTNGSSEAIREQLAHLKSVGKQNLYVFHGEYEGYEAIAKPLGFNIIKVHRTKECYNITYKKNSCFFLSQPSSVDGNLWEDYDRFMRHIAYTDPYLDIYVDICYIGTIQEEYLINLDYENIKGVFFSLSKSFGVYYHRIGGCFLKEENPLLYGNMWFKNVFAMKYGEELLNRIGVYYYPETYRKKQVDAIYKLCKERGINITKVKISDVIILATVNTRNADTEALKFIKEKLNRGNDKQVRICLTPLMEADIWKEYNEE